MAQINIRIDDDIKRRADDLFSSLGLTMSSALTVFIQHSIDFQGIPFPIQKRNHSVRPMSELLQRIDDMEHGRNCHYHDLIEVDDEIKPNAKMRRTSSTRRRRSIA